jgi:hypothetical protein
MPRRKTALLNKKTLKKINPFPKKQHILPINKTTQQKIPSPEKTSQDISHPLIIQHYQKNKKPLCKEHSLIIAAKTQKTPGLPQSEN